MSWTARCKDDRRPQFYSTFVLHCAGGLHVHEGYDVHAQAATLQVWFAKLALVHISKAIGYLKPEYLITTWHLWLLWIVYQKCSTCLSIL